MSRRPKSPMGWTVADDQAVIAAYRRLLAADSRGVSPDITAEIGRLSDVDKSPGSIRMRMQNVSAVLESRGLPRITSLSPLGNYAKQLEELVTASLPW